MVCTGALVTINGIYADLHSHTTKSDGLLQPEVLLEKAEREGIEVLAITDHDSVDAHHALRHGGYNGNVRLISGIEVSCYEHGREIHILGYHLDIDNEELLQLAIHLRAERDRRAILMVERLQNLRVTISVDEVKEVAAGAPIGRPHIAKVLVQRGFVTSHQKAFDIYLDAGKPAYVPRSVFTVTDAVNLIHRAGGIAVIAHPAKTYSEPRLFLTLLAGGIDGIEVYHPSHWYVTREYYRVLAEQHELVITGGSDYHGSRDYDDRNFGTFGISAERVELLDVRAQSLRQRGAQHDSEQGNYPH
ncbi:MAG TPA: hypothetical protein DIS79_11505 [Bacteroidetes bacterium]|nr:hypothetical protein [Bacteroidota bacterium]